MPSSPRPFPIRPRRVLLTNDDGVAAPGLALLARLVARPGVEVWTVAPDRDQSGMSRAVTLNAPLRVDARGERCFAVNGTPSDCVILALRHLMRDAPPDLVLSGINRGANLAEETPYSGTVGAALTARLLGVPAAALSQAFTRGAPVRWQTAQTLFDAVMAPILGLDGAASDTGLGLDLSLDLSRDWAAALPPDAVPNINFPDRDAGEVRGLRLTRQGVGHVRDIVVEARQDLRGGDYHWLGFQRAPAAPSSPLAPDIVDGDADRDALAAGYVTVTPLDRALAAS